MKKYTFYISIVGLLIAASAVLSCSNKKNDRGGRTDTPSGTITFYADESFSPIIEEERKQFEYTYPKAHLKAVYTDQNTGMNQLMALKTCLLITSRDLTKGESAMFSTKQTKAVSFPIGYDGVALIVNRNNTDTLITEAAARKIFSGEVTKWNQIYKHSSLGDIEVVSTIVPLARCSGWRIPCLEASISLRRILSQPNRAGALSTMSSGLPMPLAWWVPTGSATPATVPISPS